jgi:hypothetical protein
MSLKFWDEAFLAVTHLINRLPSKVTNDKTPFERLFNKKPYYSFLRTFGCACWLHLRLYNSQKLQFRSKQCIFLGYSNMHKGYKCLDVSTGRVYISHDVIFDEENFPFSELHPNVGARLKSEIALLDPTLFHHYTCGGKPIFDCIVDNPATANETVEAIGQNAGENSTPTTAQAGMKNVAAPTELVSFPASASEAASI